MSDVVGARVGTARALGAPWLFTHTSAHSGQALSGTARIDRCWRRLPKTPLSARDDPLGHRVLSAAPAATVTGGILANTHGGEEKGIAEAVEAAERAGSVVSEQIRSIMEAAQAKADEIERNAEDEANRQRQDAAEAASRLLGQIDEMEGHLSGLVQSLRREADLLSVSLERSNRD